MVKVEVTSQNAIYVDDTRITNRSTKWGGHRIVDSWQCQEDEVRSTLVKNGHGNLIHLIDDEKYLK